MRIDLYLKAVSISALLSCIAISGEAQKQSPADMEAQTMAQKLWETVLTKCGDSYYYYGTYVHPMSGTQFSLEQYKGMTFGIIPRSLSAADKLNGLEWEGSAVMGSTVYRGTSAEPSAPFEAFGANNSMLHGPWEKWGEWVDGGGLALVFRDFKRGMGWMDTRIGDGSPWNAIRMTKNREGSSNPRQNRSVDKGGRWSFDVHFVSGHALGDDVDPIHEIAQRKLSCMQIPEAVASKPGARSSR